LARFPAASEKSGEGPPQSKTLRAVRGCLKSAERFGLRQSPGALWGQRKATGFGHELDCANINMNCWKYSSSARADPAGFVFTPAAKLWNLRETPVVNKLIRYDD
jgi:hypothetical protein